MIRLLLCLLPFIIFSNNSSYSFSNNIQSDTVWFIFDEPYTDSLPHNFRKCNGSFKNEAVTLPDTTGLNGLRISGSAEFSDKNLPTIIDSINSEQLIVIDLRQETHGFVNGMPVSWYGKYDWENVGLSKEEIINEEIHKLDSLKKKKEVIVTKVLKKDKATNAFTEVEEIEVNVHSAENEEKLTKKFNVGYFRITATDHRKPTIENVDMFIKYVSSLPDDSWLHFHCHGGDGRTTTFMVMFDMMRNAKDVSFDDIIERQYLLGGINLAKDDDFPEWDKQYAIERTQFLKNFYEYCKNNE